MNALDRQAQDSGAPFRIDPGKSGLNEKEVSRAKNAAYRFLSFRPRSRSEVEKKLREKEFGIPVVQEVLEHLVRLGYVNDHEFARLWAGGRRRLRGFGRRRIEQELKTKGISSDIIRDTFTDSLADMPESVIARREADKKLRTLGRFEPEVRKRRLAGFLERRGFSSEIIVSIIRSTC